MSCSRFWGGGGKQTTVGNPIQHRNVVHRPPFGGVEHKMSIICPHAATIIDNDDDCCCGGGASCLPPFGPSCPAGRRSLLLMLPTMVNGGGTRTFGAWSYAWWRRKVRAIVLILWVLIQPEVDNGGKRRSMTLVRLCGRQHQAGE